MEFPKTLSAALCRIVADFGPDVLKNPNKLLAYMADIAPNLKHERTQLQSLVESGCAKQLAEATEQNIRQYVASAVDILSNHYLMDRKKAEELCYIYVNALSGRESNGPVEAVGVPEVKPQAQFHLWVENVFQIVGRAMVATGWVRGAAVHVGDRVMILRATGERRITTIEAIEHFHQLLDSVAPNSAVGLLLAGTKPGDLMQGDTLLGLPSGYSPESPIPFAQFRLQIDGLFGIPGRGTVVTGWVQGAAIRVGNAVTIVRANGTQRTATVAGIERYQQLLDRAEPGYAVGLLLHQVQESEVAVGDWLIRFDL